MVNKVVIEVAKAWTISYNYIISFGYSSKWLIPPVRKAECMAVTGDLHGTAHGSLYQVMVVRISAHAGAHAKMRAYTHVN